MRAALKIRITFQPAIQCLFRTEEVIHRSTTTEEDDGATRVRLDDLSLVKDDSNPIGTIRRRIINSDLLRRKFVADQRQEIDRSIRVEYAPRGKRHSVKLEVQPGLPIQVTRFGRGISYPAHRLVTFKNSQTGEHFRVATVASPLRASE